MINLFAPLIGFNNDTRAVGKIFKCLAVHALDRMIDVHQTGPDSSISPQLIMVAKLLQIED